MQIVSNVLNVAFRFTFTNRDLVPKSVRNVGYKVRTHAEMIPGVMIMENTPDCLALPALEFLKKNFVLVDASHENAKSDKQAYHIVTFSFDRDGKKGLNKAIMDDLVKLLGESMWQVSAFENPFYSKGTVIDGKAAISVNLNKRQPLFQPNGMHLLQRPKDAQGRTLKNELAVQIKPKNYLELSDKAEELMSA